MQNQKGFASIILAVVVAAILIGGVVFVWQNTAKPAPTPGNQNILPEVIDESVINLPAEESENVENIEAEDPTADWKAYTNDENDFSIKYPTDWQISAITNNPILYGVSLNSPNESIFSILPKGQLGHGWPEEDPVVFDVKIGNYQAVRKEWRYEGRDNATIVIQFTEYPESWNSDNRLEIGILNSHDEVLVEKILETFEFTDQTADWQSYNSDNYDLSFLYPKDWHIFDRLTPDTPHGFVGIGLTSPDIGGDFNWVILTYKTSDKSLGQLIADLTGKYTDSQIQKSYINIDGLPATLISINIDGSADSFPQFVFLEKNDKVYFVSNGAIRDERFTKFYQSLVIN